MELNEFRDVMMGLKASIPKWAPDFKDAVTLPVWFSAFREIELEQLKTACRLAVNTLDEFPSIKALKGICMGYILPDEQLGQDTANRIGDAIHNFGYMRPTEARAWLGELAWATILRHGSWYDLCNLETVKELEYMKKDMAKTAINIWQNHQAFGGDKALGLPEKLEYEKPPMLREALKIAKAHLD